MEIFGKKTVEVGGIRVATAVDDFLDRQIAVGQQDACFLQFQSLDGLSKILASALYQKSGHLSVTIGERLSQLVLH